MIFIYTRSYYFISFNFAYHRSLLNLPNNYPRIFYRCCAKLSKLSPSTPSPTPYN